MPKQIRRKVWGSRNGGSSSEIFGKNNPRRRKFCNRMGRRIVCARCPNWDFFESDCTLPLLDETNLSIGAPEHIDGISVINGIITIDGSTGGAINPRPGSYGLSPFF